ncbi:hypothetical protein [Nocardiopsis aegyptia]|uniref:Uncharacterized protein n=1 Tax=Nocardiopsis aegyptia TaxID=220378 RepID=A0A7Z0EMC1_9ACTN|nr:hypothetical protein [Nocardiopsis aegyptia]NYJ34661.1 hypothetical protein [Nocardiopsis aegyptia]
MKRTICDIRELPSMAALRAWARRHDVNVEYLGSSLRGEPVYGARRRVVTRVARGRHQGPARALWAWESPLERLSHGDLGEWGNHLNRKGCKP